MYIKSINKISFKILFIDLNFNFFNTFLKDFNIIMTISYIILMISIFNILSIYYN